MEERDIDRIERYLANELSAEEKLLVEQQAAADPVFQKELEESRSAILSLKIKERHDLKERLRNREHRRGKEIDLSTSARRNSWIAVAAVLILGLIGWKFLLPAFHQGDPVQHLTDQQLFADYFDPFKQDMTQPLEKGGDTLSALDQFNLDYWNSEYQKAVHDFAKIDSLLKENDNLRFRYANALLASDQFDQAEAILKNIIDRRQSQYITESQWYLAMIALKKGNRLQAREYLQTYVAATNVAFRDEAQKLLQQLGEL